MAKRERAEIFDLGFTIYDFPLRLGRSRPVGIKRIYRDLTEGRGEREQGDPTTVDGRRILERHALMQQLNHRDRKEHSVRNPSWEIHGLNSVCSITSPQASEFVLSA